MPGGNILCPRCGKPIYTSFCTNCGWGRISIHKFKDKLYLVNRKMK